MKFLNSLDILGSGGTLLDVQGSQGQLFSVTDSLSGSIFAVSDISGVPILDVNSSGTSYFSGNVGIGTAAPGAPLHVNANSHAGRFTSAVNSVPVSFYHTGGSVSTVGFKGSTSTSDYHVRVGANGDNFVAYTNNNEKLRITSAGNVGIGTTNPTVGLQLGNSTSGQTKTAIFNSEGGSEVGLTIQSRTNRAKLRVADNDSNAYVVAEDGKAFFGTSSNGDSSNITVLTSGNVGIGTTSPTHPLHVEGFITTNNSSNASGVLIRKAGSTIGFLGQSGGWVGDTSDDLGISGETGKNIRFYTNGSATERMRITSSGNVGIGLADPDSKLDINAGVTNNIPGPAVRISKGASPIGLIRYDTVVIEANDVATIRIGESDGTVSSIVSGDNNLRINSTDPIKFYTAGTTTGEAHGGQGGTFAMIINNSQNVGIGTTSPGAKLEIVDTSNPGATSGSVIIEGRRDGSPNVLTLRAKDASAPAGALPNNQGPVVRFQGFDGTDFENMGYIHVAANGQAVANGDAPSFMAFGTSADGSSSPTEKMRITAGGNVGIGTNNPVSKLQVEGDIALSNNGVIGQGSAYGNSGNSASSTLKLYDSATGATILNNQSYDIQLNTGGGNKFIVKNGGNVGIGTTSPTEKLHVEGNIELINGGWIGSLDGTYWQRIRFEDATPATTNAFNFETRNGSGAFVNHMTILNNGNVGIGATDPGANLQVYSTSNRDVFISGYGTQAQNTWQAQHAFFTSAGQGVIVGKANAGNDANRLHILYNTSNGDAQYLGYDTSNNNKVKLNTNGNSHLNGGNVGIGTTNPTAKLDVQQSTAGNIISAEFDNLDHTSGNRNAIKVRQQISAGGSYSAFLGSHKETGNLFLSNDSITADHLVIDTSGNVGIATTSPSSESNLSLGAKSTSEGGHLTLFKGTSNTHATHIDNYADSFRIMKGTDTSSSTVQFSLDHATGNAAFAGDVSLVDSKKLILGAGSDLQIYHNATDSVIENSTGDLYITNKADDKDIVFRTDDGSGGYATYFYLDGSTLENVFYKNVALRDSVKATFGNSNDLQIYHNGSNSYIDDTGTGDLYIRANNLRLSNADGSGQTINANNGGNVELFHNNSKKFETTSTGVEVTGKITNLTAGTGNLDAVNVQQLNNATTGTLVYKGTWSAAPTTTSVLDGAVSGGTIVIDAANPGISVGATITGTGISGTVTVSNIAADGITIAISSSQTIADGVTLTFTTVGGTPDLSQASRKVTGHYYICETAGAATPNGASTTPNEWAVGDWATFSDLTTDAWQKIDNSSVLSGAGTGGTIPVWSGSGTSVTLADAPITVSGNNVNFAGSIYANTIYSATNSAYYIDVNSTGVGLNTAGGATFAGNVTLSSTAPILYLANTTSSTGKTWRLSSAANGNAYITQDGVIDAITLSHTSGNATFAGDVTVTGGDLTLGTDSIASNINAVGDVLGINVDSNTGGGAGANIQLKTAGTTQLTINNSSATFAGTVTAADLLTVNGDGHLFLGATGETPKIDMLYTTNASGRGWDTRIFIGRTDDLPNAQAFPTSTIAGGFGTQYQANSDGAFFGIIPYTPGHYRPVINWGDDAADSPFSFQFNGTNVVNISTGGGVGANSFTGDHIGTINTATTGVTQTAGNNSTLIATTAYADAAAAAGGGNFLPLAGGTMTGNVIFNDSKELRLGTSSDFKGFHNGTNTHLSNYTGQLVIENYSDDKDILFASDDGSGGVTTYMYLDGSITETRFKKPSRHDDSVIAKFGDGNDLNIFHNGSNSYIETTNSSTGDFYVTARGTNHDLYLEAADDIYIRPQGNENGIKVLGNDSVELYFNNVRKIRTTTEGVIVEGDIKVDSVLLSNQENTDVDTGTETVASVPIATYTAAFFDFVIKNGTNLRAGTVFACHDGTNVVYTETSTADLGDTSDVTLSVAIDATNMMFKATTTSNDWSVKSLIRAI